MTFFAGTVQWIVTGDENKARRELTGLALRLLHVARNAKDLGNFVHYDTGWHQYPDGKVRVLSQRGVDTVFLEAVSEEMVTIINPHGRIVPAYYVWRYTGETDEWGEQVVEDGYVVANRQLEPLYYIKRENRTVDNWKNPLTKTIGATSFSYPVRLPQPNPGRTINIWGYWNTPNYWENLDYWIGETISITDRVAINRISDGADCDSIPGYPPLCNFHNGSREVHIRSELRLGDEIFKSKVMTFHDDWTWEGQPRYACGDSFGCRSDHEVSDYVGVPFNYSVLEATSGPYTEFAVGSSPDDDCLRVQDFLNIWGTWQAKSSEYIEAFFYSFIPECQRITDFVGSELCYWHWSGDWNNDYVDVAIDSNLCINKSETNLSRTTYNSESHFSQHNSPPLVDCGGPWVTSGTRTWGGKGIRPYQLNIQKQVFSGGTLSQPASVNSQWNAQYKTKKEVLFYGYDTSSWDGGQIWAGAVEAMCSRDTFTYGVYWYDAETGIHEQYVKAYPYTHKIITPDGKEYESYRQCYLIYIDNDNKEQLLRGTI